MTGDADEAVLFSAGTDSRWPRVVSVFALGGLLMGLYLWVVGVGSIQRALGHVSTRRLASLVVVGVVPVVLWGAGLHLVLVRFGVARRFVTSVFLYSAAGFLNSVTPFGQAGGDLPSALLFRRSLGTDFETGLAAIGTVNALNRTAALFLGLLGVASLGTRVAFTRTLEVAAVVTVGATASVLCGAVVAWRYRQTVGRWSARLLAFVLGPAARLPGVTPPSPDSLVERGRRFTEAVERLLDAPATLGFVFVVSVAGQLAVASTLWVALAALGTEAPFAVVVLLLPVAKLGGAAPTPGGFGSAEAVLTALMVATIGIDVASAGAAALMYRVSAFWLPSLCGGMVTAWYTVNERRSSGSDAELSPGARASLLQRAVGIRDDDEHRYLPLVLALSVALVVLLVVSVHSRHLLIEPDNLWVHTTRDSALVLLSFGVMWLGLRRVTEKLLG